MTGNSKLKPFILGLLMVCFLAPNWVSAETIQVDPDKCIPILEGHAGRVIGKGGSVVTRLQDETGATIKVTRNCLIGSSVVPETAVVIDGTPTQIKLAKQKVLSIIVKIEEKEMRDEPKLGKRKSEAPASPKPANKKR